MRPEGLGDPGDDHNPHVGRVLLGSALGTVGGVGLGAALLRGAAAAREEHDRTYGDPNEPDPTIGLAVIDAAFIVDVTLLSVRLQ
jgi:hypothetical protein